MLRANEFNSSRGTHLAAGNRGNSSVFSADKSHEANSIRGNHSNTTDNSKKHAPIWELYNDAIERESEDFTNRRVRNFKWRLEHGSMLKSWHMSPLDYLDRQFYASTGLLDRSRQEPPFNAGQRNQANGRQQPQEQSQDFMMDNSISPTVDRVTNGAGGFTNTANFGENQYDNSFSLDTFMNDLISDENAFQLDNIPLAFNALEDPFIGHSDSFAAKETPFSSPYNPSSNSMVSSNNVNTTAPSRQSFATTTQQPSSLYDPNSSRNNNSAHAYTNASLRFPDPADMLASVTSPSHMHNYTRNIDNNGNNIDSNITAMPQISQLGSSDGSRPRQSQIGSKSHLNVSPTQRFSPSAYRSSAFIPQNDFGQTFTGSLGIYSSRHPSAVSKQNRKKKQRQSAKLVFGDTPPESFGEDPRSSHYGMHELLPLDFLSQPFESQPTMPTSTGYSNNGRSHNHNHTHNHNQSHNHSNTVRNGNHNNINNSDANMQYPAIKSSPSSTYMHPNPQNVSPRHTSTYGSKPEHDHLEMRTSSPGTSAQTKSASYSDSGEDVKMPVQAPPVVRGKSQENLVCMNCKTRTTPLWRRDDDQNALCNACGLFYKLHGTNRPLKLKTDVIKRRNRQMDDIPMRRRRRRLPPKTRGAPLEPAKPSRISPKPIEASSRSSTVSSTVSPQNRSEASTPEQKR